MSEVVINVTKVEEVVTINATPNVTQILVNTNSGGGIQSVVAGTNITIDDTDPLNPIISASGGGGAVDSVNGQTGVVVLDADDISETATRFWLTNILKTTYDDAVTWITTNGTNILNHIASTSNPHNVTKSQVGLSNVVNSDTTTTANITDSTNKRFVTDANLVVIGNTSGTNSGDNASNTTSNSYADAKVASELASFKTANFLDFTSSGQAQLNLKADKSTASIVLKNNFTPNTLTAPITTETIVDNYDLGVGFLSVGESLSLYAELVKNELLSGTAQTFLYLSKVSNSISVTDAVKIATSSSLGTGNGSNYIERTFHRKSSSILSCRVLGTSASLTDKVSSTIGYIPQKIINDATLSDYRFLIVTSTYTATSSPNTIQTNIILTKNPVV